MGGEKEIGEWLGNGDIVLCAIGRTVPELVYGRLAARSTGGVTTSLLGDTNPAADRWLRPTAVDNLCLLASGPLPPNPAEMVGSSRMGQLIEYLGTRADVVIFDSPPVRAVTDAALLSRPVEGVLLVVRCGRTRQKEARRAMAELARVDAPVLGVVINKTPMGKRGDYYYRDYYAAAGEAEGDKKTL